MNWDQIEGKWKELKGSAKQQWAKFTDDDLEYIAGRRESLIGKIQERYGFAREEAQRKADEWVKTLKMQGAQQPGQTPEREVHQAGKR
jgi:uncharacterized protein YjbJ (UPF0337 family)